MGKHDDRRDEERQTEQYWENRRSFNCFAAIKNFQPLSAIKGRLTSVGTFSQDRTKYLTIADKTCGGKRRVPVLKRLDQNPLYMRRRNSDPGLNLTTDDECMRRRNSDPVCVRQRNSDPVLSVTDPVSSDTEDDLSNASTAVPDPTSDEDIEPFAPLPGMVPDTSLAPVQAHPQKLSTVDSCGYISLAFVCPYS